MKRNIILQCTITLAVGFLKYSPASLRADDHQRRRRLMNESSRLSTLHKR